MPNPSQSSNAGTSYAWGGGSSTADSKPTPAVKAYATHSSLLLRQIVSFPVNALLWSTALPFSPLAWLIGAHEGAFLIDRFAGGLILLSALYFQFQLASQTGAVVITLANPLKTSDAYVRGGRVERGSSGGGAWAFLYQPGRFLLYAGVEVALLLLCSVLRLEFLRRGIVLVVVGALWAGGWRVTPQATKRWAWGHIKWYWTWIVFDVLRDVYAGGRAGARRRRY